MYFILGVGTAYMPSAPVKSPTMLLCTRTLNFRPKVLMGTPKTLLMGVTTILEMR